MCIQISLVARSENKILETHLIEDKNILNVAGIYDVLSDSGLRDAGGHKKFNLRCKFCGYEVCMRIKDAKRAKTCKHPREFPDRFCEYCGELIEKKGIYSDYIKRKFCNSSCAATFHNYERTRVTDSSVSAMVLKIKPCINCGQEMDISSYKGKKYCSVKCHCDFLQKQWVKQWLADELDNGTIDSMKFSHTRMRNYLFELYGSKCSICGWGEVNPYTQKIPLDVEHIDGNYQNNRPENVTLLCPNCHSLTKTYKGANRGNGREHRRLRYKNIENIIRQRNNT